MQIVIDIPKDMYSAIKSGKDGYSNYVHTAVRNGTPLPKGHGRLVDADAITKDFNTLQDAFTIYTDGTMKMAIGCNAPTIIEADKESENKE